LNTTTLTTILVSYLCGAIPFGILIGLGLRKIDIRQHGSGNIGATNAIRILGWPLGILILILDISKGALPLIFIKIQFPELEYALPTFGAATILGHVFPITLKFKGGKGVATAAGVILILHPLAFTLALLIFITTLTLTRYVSLSSLLATSSLLISSIALNGLNPAFKEELPKTLFLILTTTIVFWRHLGNMRRLVAGTESQLGDDRGQDHSDPESEKRGVAQLG
jgi:acyl phosphate:glycerol-3-phosphate acyltransferase